METINLTVENINSSMRLDSYVSQNNSDVSRSRLKNGIVQIKVNNQNAKLSTKVKSGDNIFIEWEDPIPSDVIPNDIPLDILYEDENVTVVNKKQGMVTHPASGNWENTLVNALLFHWGRNEIHCNDTLDKTSVRQRRTGIVHRLDKDTSGTIITAKNRDSELWLQKQFKKHAVKKIYIAIVKGIPPKENGSIKTQLIRDPRNRKRFTTTQDTSRGKFSHTIYRCIAVYGNYSLMVLKLKTGRTHQIRVHLKSIGCPIVGDPIYGVKDKLFDSATLMLHSRKLGVRLPSSKNTFTEFTAPVPLRFKKVLQKLHKMFQRTSIYIRNNQ